MAEEADVRGLGQVVSTDLSEVSGLAVSRQNPKIVWIHDDGDIRDVYAVRWTGQFVVRLRLPEKLTDVEDVAIGPGPMRGMDYLYLADIGDNDQERPFVRIVRILEPSLAEQPGGTWKADRLEEFRLSYPDGACDAEALLVDNVSGDVLIVTKEKDVARIFAAPANRLRAGRSLPTSLQEVARLDVDKVSAGDMSRDGRRIVLRREERGWLWTRNAGESPATAFTRRPQTVVVRGKRQAENGEAIGFHPSGDAYLTMSEGEEPWIYAFRIRLP